MNKEPINWKSSHTRITGRKSLYYYIQRCFKIWICMKYFILTNLLDITFSIGGRVYNMFTVGHIISITCVLVSTRSHWSYFNACSLCKTRYCLLDWEMCLLFKPWYWQRPHSYHITLPHICIRVMREVGPDSWTEIIQLDNPYFPQSWNCIQFSTCYDEWTTVDTQTKFDKLQRKLPYSFTNHFVEKYILDDTRLPFYTEWATRHATRTVTHCMPVCEPTNLMVCDIIDYVRQNCPLLSNAVILIMFTDMWQCCLGVFAVDS
jgi:hypothetical protein